MKSFFCCCLKHIVLKNVPFSKKKKKSLLLVKRVELQKRSWLEDIVSTNSTNRRSFTLAILQDLILISEAVELSASYCLLWIETLYATYPCPCTARHGSSRVYYSQEWAEGKAVVAVTVVVDRNSTNFGGRQIRPPPLTFCSPLVRHARARAGEAGSEGGREGELDPTECLVACGVWVWLRDVWGATHKVIPADLSATAIRSISTTKCSNWKYCFHMKIITHSVNQIHVSLLWLNSLRLQFSLEFRPIKEEAY